MTISIVIPILWVLATLAVQLVTFFTLAVPPSVVITIAGYAFVPVPAGDIFSTLQYNTAIVLMQALLMSLNSYKYALPMVSYSDPL